MKNTFTKLLRRVGAVGLGLVALAAQAQSDGYSLPFDKDGSVRAYSLSANNRQGVNTTYTFDVAENNIEIGDTLVVRLQPQNVDDLVLRLRFCPGDCERLSQRDGSTVLVGDREVFVGKTTDLRAKNYTLKFPIETRSRYLNDANEPVFFDNTNLSRIYVSVGNLNQTRADFNLKVSLLKPGESGRAVPLVTRTIRPSLREGRYHALLVGVNDYDDPRLRLKRPAVDVARLDSALTTRYEFATVRVMLSPTKREFLDALKTLAFELTNEDNLLLFFAGHAIYQQPTGYWAFRDTGESLDGYLSTAVLLDELRHIHTQHQLVVVDACFGTAVVASRDLRANTLATWDQLYNERSWQAMSSTFLQETPDNSVFLDYFIKKLAQNGEQYLTGEEIFNSLKYPVHNRTRRNQRPQFGDLNGFDKTSGEFIFKRKTTASPPVVRLMYQRGAPGNDSLWRPPVRVVNLSDLAPTHDSLLMRGPAGEISVAGATVMNRGNRPASLRFSQNLQKWDVLTIPPRTSTAVKIPGREVIVELPNDSAFPTRKTLQRGKTYQLDWANASRPVDLIWVR